MVKNIPNLIPPGRSIIGSLLVLLAFFVCGSSDSFLSLGTHSAFAQNTLCPTAPPGTSDNRCASTAFVQTAVANASGFGPMNGPCILGNAGDTPALPAVICGILNQVPMIFSDGSGWSWSTFEGDFTCLGTSGIATCTISPHAVTYGKIQQESAATILGNPTGSTANVQEITLGSGLSFSGSTLIATGGTGTVTSVTCGTGLTGGTFTTSGTCAIDFASNSNIWGGTANKTIDAAHAQTAIAPVTLSISTSTFTPAFGSGINVEMTLVHSSCPCTIANPTGVYAGLNGFMTIIQSSTGSDTIGTWGSTWKFQNGNKPTLSTGAGAVDTLGFYCRTTTFCEVTVNGFNFQ